MKQYYLQYESDRVICGSNDHEWGRASTVKTARGYISKVRKTLHSENPRNFRIYDAFGEVEPTTNHAPCVYQED